MILAESSKSHSWSWLGEEGKRIQRVLADVDEDDVMKALEARQNYLGKNFDISY